MKKYCKKCLYGDINFWGYTECYRFNNDLDFEITKNTADREKTASFLNKNNDCKYFEHRNSIIRFFIKIIGG